MPDSKKYVSSGMAAILLYAVFFGGLLQVHAQVTSQLVGSGRVSYEGRETPYKVRHLPVSSFPDLPAPIAAELTSRGCLIPQTYGAHRPENVVHGSLQRAGSDDWAVLCSSNGEVSLLIFFAGVSSGDPLVLSKFAEIDRLQPHDPSGELGFNWGIDPASPARVHDAMAGQNPRPTPLDHDALADSILDSKTIYHLYRNGVWEQVVVDQSR